MKDELGIVKFVVYIIILLLGIGISYGAINVRVDILETKAVKQQADHELIVILNTKMDRLAFDLREIKCDLKELKSR